MSSLPLQNILVLVDGTESGIRAAEYAVQLARAGETKVTAISVVDTDSLHRLMSARILVEPEMRELESDLERSQRRHLDYVALVAGKVKVHVDTVLRKGVCHLAVLEEQKARGADVIIVGGGAARSKLDLIARERHLILQEAPCPVLVVK